MDLKYVNKQLKFQTKCKQTAEIPIWFFKTFFQKLTFFNQKLCFVSLCNYLEDVAEVSRPAHYSLMTHLHCWALMRLMSQLRIDVAQLNFAIHLDYCPVTFHENFHSKYFHVRFLAMSKLFDLWMRTQLNTERKNTVGKKCLKMSHFNFVDIYSFHSFEFSSQKMHFCLIYLTEKKNPFYV